MVARKKKARAAGHEGSIPSPPGYSAVPVKFSEKQQASHYLYVRQHRVRQDTQSTWPANRTLFILNVPPYCTKVGVCRGTSGF
ncbi:Ribosomal RNA-processing protein 7-like protein A [Microtus ochrogaster]|uniref:Ribosomal RNA-processing protein 7-like protein A n=1 Tax=Microtus ochrogaster TaxID=79684 RepID=A0A8J6GLT6_MICOH|nr:Ribosomal RNA-processing protein 7-like protein A [Microtus ochrogaster]